MPVSKPGLGRRICSNPKCKHFGRKQPIELFYKHKRSKGGRRARCKSCGKDYRESHRSQIADTLHRWYERNKKAVNLHNREYDHATRQERRAKKTRYMRDKRRTDLQFRLASQLRTRLNDAVRGKVKSGSAVRNLGCSISQLKEHLESKFLPGMSWSNQGHGRGKWQIDHIKALATFDLIQRKELLAACHYTNLQPLWALDNIKKGSK